MGRVLHGIEKGLRIFKENSDTLFVDIIFDAGAPAGTAGETDAAPIGSIYTNTTNGGIWKKIANTSSASDWLELGDVTIDELVWRNEKVRFATADTLSVGSVDVLALSDNDDLVYGDVNVGEHVIGDVDGTPTLFEVTATPGSPNITIAAVSQAIADGDTFVVQQFLPDPTGQEDQAIIHFPLAAGPGVKIGDINWDFATGINISGGYTPASGNPSSSDSVESAIEKLDGNNDAQDTTLGTAQGATSMGSFASPASLLLAASQSVKALFQRIGDLLAQLRGVEATGITAEATVDSVVVDDVKAVKWLVHAFEEATPANVKAFEVYAMHNGTASADATLADNTVFSKLKLGSNFDLDLSVDINGAGGSQEMRLRVASSSGGVTVTARRIEVLESVL